MKLGALLSRFIKGGQVPAPAKEEDDLGIYRTSPSKPVVMVTVLGVNPDVLDEIVTVMCRKFEPGHRLVFLTDSTDFALFRRLGLAFEYLPSHLDQRVHADALAWPAYLAERWALLLAKWRPVHIIAYGQNFDAFLGAAPRAATSRAPQAS